MSWIALHSASGEEFRFNAERIVSYRPGSGGTALMLSTDTFLSVKESMSDIDAMIVAAQRGGIAYCEDGQVWLISEEGAP
jgi:hypothetical protein